MKMNKKLVACTLVTAMAVSPMSVFAADETSEEKANNSITGAGDMEGWVDEDQFLVTLPTTTAENLAFKLDPQGLLGKLTPDDDGDDTLGTIIFGENAKVTLTNKSSYDVGFDVTLSLISTDKDLKVVNKTDQVEVGEDRNIYLAAQPIESDAVVEGKDIPLEADADTTDTVAGIKKFAYALKDSYALYKVTGTHEAGYKFALDTEKDTSTCDTVTFGLTGLVNSSADWSNFAAETDADTLSLEVSYTVKKLGVEYDDITGKKAEDVEFVEGVHGLLTTAAAPAVEAAPSAPSAANFMNGKNLANTEVYFTEIEGVSLGKAGLAATGIAKVGIKTSSTATTATNLNKLAQVPPSTTSGAGTKGYMYDADTETLTLYGPIMATTIAAGTKQYLVVEFNDTAKTTVTIELTNTLRD